MRLYLLIIITLFLYSQKSEAQSFSKKTKETNIVISTHPIKNLLKRYNLGIEYKSNKMGSFILKGAYTDRNTFYQKQVNGVEAELQYRFYINPEKIKENPSTNRLFGAYYHKMGVIQEDLSRFHQTSYMENNRLTYHEGGLIGGIQKIISQRFVGEIFMGAAWRSSDSNFLPETNGASNSYVNIDLSKPTHFASRHYSGLKPVLGLKLGIVL